jgi:hypothetical protein
MTASILTSPSTSRRVADEPIEASPTPHWTHLYTIGAAAALLTTVLIPIHVLVFIVWPPPLDGGAIDWFEVFQDNRLLGLLSMDLLLIADYVLLIPIVLALYVALRRFGPSLMLLGAGLFFVAVALYLASNPAFEMLSLSERYAEATTDAQRAGFLAAGEGLVAAYTGTAFHVSYILGSTAGILISVGMLRGGIFSKPAAYAGILGNLVGFGLYVPVVGIALGVISGLVLWLWYALLAHRLFQLARKDSLHRGSSTA